MDGGLPWANVLAGAYRFSWTGSDLSGMASYQVQRRTGTSSAAFGARTSLVTSERASTVTVAPGQTVCLGAGGTDAHGNITSPAAAAEVCRTAPVDDRSLKAVGNVRLLTGNGYFRATATQLTGTGSTLTRTLVRASSAELVVASCPSCGSVSAWYDGRKVKTTSLRTSAVQLRRVIALPAPGSGVDTVTLRPTSSSPVRIDGLVLRTRG